MELSLIQRFGTGATLLTSTTSVTASSGSPKLVIDLSDYTNTANGGDIANSQGLNDVSLITNSTKDTYADKIAAAQIVLWKQNQPTENSDETVGIYIEDPYKQFYTRNSTEQLAFIYGCGIYIDDPTANLDPDDVV
jgi:hypothetical protein